MRAVEWAVRLGRDPRVWTVGEGDRDGELWVYVECRNAGAYSSLFDTLWTKGWRTLARRSHDSLWVERAQEWGQGDGYPRAEAAVRAAGP
jgi:hypothetical protein